MLVDVAISAFGKPYHTAVTLLSLLEHSGQHIDRIYFQEEREQPYGADVSAVLPLVEDRAVIHHRPEFHLGWAPTDLERIADEGYRHSIRYQYAWEKTDKQFLFITHNDCLFTHDIVGDMLSKLGDEAPVAVGPIGQCWNCPAAYAGACTPDRIDSFNPTYAEMCELLEKHPAPRTFPWNIDPEVPMPLPECRLNEFYCLIDIAKARPLVAPHGDIPPFGTMALDVGTLWFRQLYLRGHRFSHWFDPNIHGWSNAANGGHGADTDEGLYDKLEEVAKAYLFEHYESKFDKLTALLPA